jgi:hypothetical protein
VAIAERVNRRLLGFLQFWDKGILLLLAFGTASAIVAACLHYAFLKPRLENGFQAALLALLFGGSRVTLLLFTGIAECIGRPSTARLGRLLLAFAVTLSVISALMSIMLIFQSEMRPLGLGDIFTNGSLILVLLVLVLELCLFAGFWLPIALHAHEIRSILERKRVEEEAVIDYIYALRAQRIREGQIDLAASSFLLRLRTLFMQKKKEISHEPTQ